PLAMSDCLGTKSMGRLVGLSLLGLSGLIAPARAQETGWTISEYNIQLQIRPDGVIEVDETITADFGIAKRGIYREIPIRYDVGTHQYALRFELLGVDDGEGHHRTTETTYHENLVKLRIGDADRALTGRQVYRIRYQVERAVLWEGEHSVLRWNATGTEWRGARRPAARIGFIPKAPRTQGGDHLARAAGARARETRATAPAP